MTFKSRNYFISLKMFNFFLVQKENIFLFVHSNNMSILDSNLISSYCVENNISNLNIKSTLYKKMFKNEKFLDIFSGPTRLFVFQNFITFINFLNNDYVKKNLVPLTIFWNNTFYIYSWFLSNMFDIYKNDLKQLQNSNTSVIKIIFAFENYFLKIFKILNFNYFDKNQINKEVNVINTSLMNDIKINYN